MRNDGKMVLSPLSHTWILDLDGTILKHNGYMVDGKDSLVEGALDFMKSIPDDDMIIFITSRKADYKVVTEKFLANTRIRFDVIIYGAPYGERILVNDQKPSGLNTAIAINIERNRFYMPMIDIDENI